MPLNKGTSDRARSQNIGELIRSGRSKEQAAAIAYHEQRKNRAKKGGKK